MNAIPSMMTTDEVVADVNDMRIDDTQINDTPTTVHTKAAESARARIKREHERNKLDKRLTREVGRAIGDFNMIEEGDKVMVCLSGGKDSYGMLDILLKLRERAPIHFDIIAVNLDQKQPGFPDHILPQYLADLGVPFHIETQDTYSIVTRVIEEGKTMCSLCSRLRRGILYRVADELGATKIALGHHRDDIVATFFLNMFYGGTLKSMPAKLVSDDGRHTVIRPLAYVKEADLIEYADWKGFPIIPCNLCGSQENLKRKESSRLIATWEKQFPGRIDNIFNALSRVRPSHLMDRDLFDFVNLSPTGVPDADGDTAFDAIEPVSATAAVSSEADTAAASPCGSADDTQAGKAKDGASITEHAVHFLRPKGN